jgi:hypothetical protein
MNESSSVKPLSDIAHAASRGLRWTAAAMVIGIPSVACRAVPKPDPVACATANSPPVDPPGSIASRCALVRKNDPALAALAAPRDYSWSDPLAVVCPPEPASPVMPADAGAASAASPPEHERPAGAAKTVSNAESVLGGMRPGFRACFEDEMLRLPCAQGTARVTMHVDCRGKLAVMSARAEGLDQQTVECIFKVAALATFDPPEGGSAVIQVPVTFILQ